MDDVLLDGPRTEGYGYLTRPLTPDELDRPEISSHPVVRFWHQHGVPASEVGDVHVFGCEGPEFETRFIPRQPWLVLLMIEPMSDTPITVTEVTGVVEGSQSERADVTVAMPPIPFDRSDAVLIPLGVSLPPFPYREEYTKPVWDDTTRHGHYQRVLELDPSITEAKPSDFETIPPFMTSLTVRFNAAGKQHTHRVHEYDPTRAVAIDSLWLTGTCPHLFERTTDGEIRYVREIIRDSRGAWTDDHHEPSADCEEIVIAELEYEVTFLKSVEQANVSLLEPTVLHRGESVRIALRSLDPIRVVGRYLPAASVTRPGGSVFKAEAINEFLARHRHATDERATDTRPELRRHLFRPVR